MESRHTLGLVPNSKNTAENYHTTQKGTPYSVSGHINY